MYYDIRRLEKDIINGEAKNEVRLIDTAITKECTEFIQREKERLAALDKPVFPFIPPKISAPKGLKDGFKFHRYQLEAISWMRSIENNTDKEFKYCDLMPWRGSRSKIILVDLHNRKFVSSTKIDEYIGSLKSKGGILADAVGLGKTLEILGLVLDGLTRSQEILPEFDESGLLNTKATLVICPNHLTSQWCSEIAKFTDLKVTSLPTVDQIRTTTYGDIMDSDFVLIPCQTFKNKNYFSLGCGKKKVSVSMAGLNKRNTLVAQYLLEIKNGKQPTREIAGPVLDHFNWPRIIVDEAHEVFNDQFACKYMFGLQKRLAWYVSATPFPSESLFVAAKKFLEIWETDYESEQTLGDQYEECVENDLIASNLLWRNTKEGAQGEYSVPDYDEEIILTDFSPIEALLHKYGTEQDNMLLCCGLLKPSNETFDEYKKSKIKATEEAIARERTWAVGTFDFNRKQMLQNKLVDLQNIPDVMQEGVIGAEFERLQLINNYGSKMTKLIGWLKDAIKEDSNNRFILFSKYLDYLHKVAKRLLMCDIPCVLMSGTGAQKNEKLKKFKEENIQVILLSLEKSASGLNLIEANHVVLLDPMDGTVEEARATEVQALGRAHRQGQDQKVTLVRFIIQDSVEEELYLRNKTTARGTNGNTNVRRAGSKILAKSTSQTSLQRILEQ
jgi:SNF2 family DNA or RNA helicase